ncbi:hypothetical protein HDU76_006699 [Blyttiomyces sp. JEL0837]|nr:hypothetical protein HDU76_006699 [Blyttiomyces sp. JEL0837]
MSADSHGDDDNGEFSGSDESNDGHDVGDRKDKDMYPVKHEPEFTTANQFDVNTSALTNTATTVCVGCHKEVSMKAMTSMLEGGVCLQQSLCQSCLRNPESLNTNALPAHLIPASSTTIVPPISTTAASLLAAAATAAPLSLLPTPAATPRRASLRNVAAVKAGWNGKRKREVNGGHDAHAGNAASGESCSECHSEDLEDAVRDDVSGEIVCSNCYKWLHKKGYRATKKIVTVSSRRRQTNAAVTTSTTPQNDGRDHNHNDHESSDDDESSSDSDDDDEDYDEMDTASAYRSRAKAVVEANGWIQPPQPSMTTTTIITTTTTTTSTLHHHQQAASRNAIKKSNNKRAQSTLLTSPSIVPAAVIPLPGFSGLDKLGSAATDTNNSESKQSQYYLLVKAAAAAAAAAANASMSVSPQMKQQQAYPTSSTSWGVPLPPAIISPAVSASVAPVTPVEEIVKDDGNVGVGGLDLLIMAASGDVVEESTTSKVKTEPDDSNYVVAPSMTIEQQKSVEALAAAVAAASASASSASASAYHFIYESDDDGFEDIEMEASAALMEVALGLVGGNASVRGNAGQQQPYGSAPPVKVVSV